MNDNNTQGEISKNKPKILTFIIIRQLRIALSFSKFNIMPNVLLSLRKATCQTKLLEINKESAQVASNITWNINVCQKKDVELGGY